MSLQSNGENIIIYDKKIGFPLILLLFYIFYEYARPKFLAPIRPMLICQGLLVLCLLSDTSKLFAVLRIKFFRLYMGLLALMVLNIFLAVNWPKAFAAFQAMLTYFIIGIAFCVFLDSSRKLLLLLHFYVGVLAVCAVDRLLGLGVFGAVGPMGDENDFALAMNVSLPIAFFLSLSAKSWKKTLLLLAVVLFALGTMESASRGGFLSLVAVGGCCWLYSQHKLRIIALLFVLAIGAWNFATPEFRAEILEIGSQSAEHDTGKDRVELWKVGWRAFKDNPILGVGQGNMPMVMETYQFDEKGESYWQRGLWGRSIHSIYFTILPELGIVGIGIFLAMLISLQRCYMQFSTVKNIFCKEQEDILKNLGIGIRIGMLGFFVAGFFLSAFYYPQFWNFSALSIVVSLIYLKTNK